MKRLSKLRVSWLIIMVVAFLVACGSSQDKIVGKWADKTSGMEVMEFFKDKTFTMNEGAKKAVFTGRWNVLDDGRIKVDVTAFGGTTVFFFILIGDELEIDMDGKRGRLVKISATAQPLGLGGTTLASSPRDQAVAPPVASGERRPGSISGLHPNWHGRWQGESEGSRLDIGPGGISKTSLRKGQDGKTRPSTENCKWTAKTEPSEAGCRSGYAASSKALSQIQAEFEQSVEAYRRDPADFAITDPVRARQAFSAIRPGNYRVVWAEGEGDCSRFEMIIDADTILSTMQCHYGHDIERFTRIR